MIERNIGRIDYNAITLRRVQVIQERQEYLYLSLHITMMAVLCAVLIALYKARADILDRLPDK
jgi:hypothetical protein